MRIAAALCLLLAWPLAAGALQLDDVMGQLRGVPERHATFEETKRIALVNGPLVRRGTLDRVDDPRARTTAGPRPSTRRTSRRSTSSATP